MDGPQPSDATSSGKPLEEAEDNAVLNFVFTEASGNHGGATRPEDGQDEDEKTHAGIKLDSANFFSVRPGVETVHHLKFYYNLKVIVLAII